MFYLSDVNKTTSYTVFPGIELIYNDYHSYGNIHEKNLQGRRVMVIDYCQEGRIEWELKNKKYYYLGKGDLSIHMQGMELKRISFPLEHYHGISLHIDIDGITTIKPMLHSFGVDIFKLSESMCSGNQFYIERTESTIEHIFSELYKIPDKIKDTYIKIKILELLLFLSAIDVSSKGEHRDYIKKSDIEKIKRIKEYMMDHVEEKVTLSELANTFSISQTLLKSCFKSIYGMPIYSFIRSYRMQKAAYLLSKGNEKVTDIALLVGYSNSSKFSAAFKSEMGLSPLEYKKQCELNGLVDEMEHKCLNGVEEKLGVRL